MSLADTLLEAWYEGRKSLIMLRPLSALYKAVAQRRRKRFLSGESASYKAPVPVIVVGNITVGGTGKTPMILFLIDYLRARGVKVGVVSRGYGAKPPSLPWRVRSDQAAEIAGDEPLLIVQRTEVPLMIDPDRSRAVQQLLEQEPLDLILCDDGLQHYRLQRDLELVLIDAARGLGNGQCLPEGPLREPESRLQAVDAVLLNGQPQDDERGFAFTLQPSALVHLATGRRQPLDHFPPGQALHAVAGIGNPARFFRTLQTLNWQPIAHAFPDHAALTADQLKFAPSLPVVMTEKDAVKCRGFAADDWWYLAVEARPSAAFEAWLDGQLLRLLNSKEGHHGPQTA